MKYVLYICRLLGTFEKEVYYGEEAIEKATSYLKPFGTDNERVRKVLRFRKREKSCSKDIEEIHDWEYFLGTVDNYYTYIALKKK